VARDGLERLMSALWSKLRPHLLSWHMIPCLVMLAVGIGAAIVAGQPSRVFGAVVCMVTMMVTMSAMGGNAHADADADAESGSRSGDHSSHGHRVMAGKSPGLLGSEGEDVDAVAILVDHPFERHALGPR
jgi:hypothetical protein